MNIGGRYSVVIESWDGIAHSERIVIGRDTFKVCCAKAEELDGQIEFLGEWDWSEDYQRWERQVGQLYQWTDVQVRHLPKAI